MFCDGNDTFVRISVQAGIGVMESAMASVALVTPARIISILRYEHAPWRALSESS